MPPGARIPFNRPSFAGGEQAYIAEAIRGGHVSGDGPFTKRCQQLLEEALSAPRVLLTTSCTDALEMSALLLNLRPGDEVVVPAFTFVSTANAFALHGARPVFADIRPDTLNLDESLLAGSLTERTRAIVPVHYGGVGCEMRSILAAAGARSIAVIEDNAHGLFGARDGRMLGSMGAMGTLSFHETKNFHCGEGGALVLNDASLAERAEILREKGTDRSRFFRGQVDKYTWVDTGSSFLPSDLLAAFLLAQLQARDSIQRRRSDIWHRYANELEGWAAKRSIRTPTIPAGCEPAWHLFQLVMPTAESRDRFIAHMRERGILCVFHYLPLHLSPMGVRFGGRKGACPVAEDVADRLVRLPFCNSLAAREQEQVIAAALEFEP